MGSSNPTQNLKESYSAQKEQASESRRSSRFPGKILRLLLLVAAVVLAPLVLGVVFPRTFSSIPKQISKGKYRVEDTAAVVRFRLGEIVGSAAGKASSLLEGKRKAPQTGSPRSLIEVSESGKVGEEESKVKGAVLGDEDEPIYYQYLPVPSISNFSTSTQTAGATISYPIEAPPGPGGLKPQVALSYSSARVDGLFQFVKTGKKHRFVRQSGPLGLGWGVSGGSFSVSVDTHGETDPNDSEEWTYHLNFPGGGAELIKVDDDGNKISRDKESSWEAGHWATDPELFVRFLETPSGYQTDGPRWRIKTADGKEYVFEGRGRSIVHVWCLPQGGGTCDWRCNEIPVSWNLKKIKTPLGQEITYSYERFGGDVKVPGDLGCSADYVGRASIKKIAYGPNEIEFVYGQSRKDWRIVKEKGADEADDGSYVLEKRDSGQLGHRDNNDAIASLTDKAISEVRVKVSGEVTRKYKLAYYDSFTKIDQRRKDKDVQGVARVKGTEWCGHCPEEGVNCCPDGFDPECTHWNGEGCYKIVEDDNGGATCDSKCKDAGWDSGWCNDTLAGCPYHLGGGDQYCDQDDPYCCCARDTEPGYWVYGVYNLSDGLKSYHLHLKSIQEFGRDGVRSLPAQTFTYQRVPYRKWWDNGGTLVDQDALNSVYIKAADNGYGGRVTYTFEDLQHPVKVCYGDSACKWDSKNTAVKRDGKEVNFSLQRAKLKMTKTEDGKGDWWQTHYIYADDQLGGMGYMKEDPQRYEYLGHWNVERVVGAKGADIVRGFGYSPGKVESISKTFYHRILKGPGCIRKSPAAGLPVKTWVMDETGRVLSETLKNYKFNAGGSWAEQCSAYKAGQIPLLLSEVSASANYEDGFLPDDPTDSLYRDYCGSHNCAKSRTENVYDWDFAQTSFWNRDNHHYAALKKSFDYGDEEQPGDDRTKCMDYCRQTEGDNWLLNKPKATWVQDGSGGDCPSDINSGPAKYQYKQFYYDGRNSVPGSLPAANPKGLVTKVETIEGDSGESMSVFREYDQYGNVVKKIDARGNPSFTRYYSGGIFPREEENALGHKSNTEYDFGLGVPTKVTDPNGAVTEYAYDALGRLTKVAQPGDSLSSPTSVFTYFINAGSKNAPLAVHKKVKVGGGEVLESYDFYNGIGEKFETQSLEPDGKALTNVTRVNSLGKTVAAYLPFKHGDFGAAVEAPGDVGKSQTEYDLRGRAVKTVTPDGRETRNLFREADFLSASVDSESRVVVSKQEGRVQKTINCREKSGAFCPERGGLVTTYYQDVLGNTTKVVDSAGNTVTETEYDTLGRKEWTEDEDLGRYEYRYDKNGNLTWQKDPLGNEITFGYDALDRREWKKFNGEETLSYEYDNCPNGVGRKCKFSDQYQETSYVYDGRGRLERVSKSFADGGLAGLFGTDPYVTGYEYDNLDRTVAVTYPETSEFGAERVEYDFDGVYLKKVAGRDEYVKDLDYNVFGQVTRRKLGSGAEEAYSYDTLNQRLKTIGVDAGGEKVLDLEYDDYSPAGNILSVDDKIYETEDELSMDQDFTYDDFYRLTGASGAYPAQFDYDDLDRMTYKWEGLERYGFDFGSDFPYHGVKAVNGEPVDYDPAGNILSYDIGGLERVLEWDYSIGKPRKVTVSQEDGQTTVDFYYDGEGTRLAKVVDETNFTLYAGPRLEKAVAGGETIWRKNYLAGGKLVAVRNIGGEPVTLEGDVDDNGEVNVQDAQELIYNFGSSPENPRADINGDRRVNGLDFGLVLKNIAD